MSCTSFIYVVTYYNFMDDDWHRVKPAIIRVRIVDELLHQMEFDRLKLTGTWLKRVCEGIKR